MKKPDFKHQLMRTAAALFTALLLSACSFMNGDTRVVLTTGISGKDVFRIDKSVCTQQEIMVYLLNAQSRYQESFGAAVTAASSSQEGSSQDEIKEYCLALTSQIKAMGLLAESLGITLDEKDLEHAAAAAAAYYAGLSQEALQALDDITREKLEEMYAELALANKVYLFTVRDVNPEISDDEARSVSLEQIYTAKNEDPARALARITQAQARFLDGEDFAMLAEVYNEEARDRVTVGRDDVTDLPVEEAFALETGETSEIIETETGYYLLRCVSAFDREQTRANKEVLLASRKREAFARVYNEFVRDLPVELNEELWALISVPEDAVSTEFWKYFEIFFNS